MTRAMPSMTGPAGCDAEIVRISTEDFPPHDRLEAWREIVGRAVLKFEIERVPGQRYHADLALRALPNLSMSDGRATGMQFRRTTALTDSDDLVMHVSLGGGFLAQQRGREITLEKGSAVAMLGAEPSLVTLLHEKFYVFRVPSNVVRPMVANPDAVLARPIPNGTEALRLLAYYANDIRNMSALAKPEVQHLAATHIHDLIALALGATHDAAELARGRGVRAARLRAIKADINKHITCSDLSIAKIAALQRLTPRYVQMLFEHEGTTFTEFVLAERLIRAYRMLTDPRLAEHSVISVAFDAGFHDLSYFNRTFRRRYNATPSDVRAAARIFDPHGERGHDPAAIPQGR